LGVVEDQADALDAEDYLYFIVVGVVVGIVVI
jgi:hypothetical protein